jgi:hypothetical protein
MNQSSDKTGTSDTTKTNGKPFVLKSVEGIMARMSSSNVCVAREDFLRANEELAGKITGHVDVADASDAPTVFTADADADEQIIEQGRELARLKDENTRLKRECAIANVFSLREVKELWQLPLNDRNETYVPTGANARVVTQLANADVRVTPVELPMHLGDPEARIGVPGGYVVKVAVVEVPFADPQYMVTYHHSELPKTLVEFRPMKGLKVVPFAHNGTFVIELSFLYQPEAAVMKAFALKMLGQRAATIAMKGERLSGQLGAGEPTEAKRG